MNFYIRNSEGDVKAGVIIEDYFDSQPGDILRGSLYGQYGDRKLNCQKR
jgi:hypothetical protein